MNAIAVVPSYPGTSEDITRGVTPAVCMISVSKKCTAEHRAGYNKKNTKEPCKNKNLGVVHTIGASAHTAINIK